MRCLILLKHVSQILMFHLRPFWKFYWLVSCQDAPHHGTNYLTWCVFASFLAFLNFDIHFVSSVISVIKSCEHFLTLFVFYLQPIIIDARGHLFGRLASIVAKTILNGEFACRSIVWTPSLIVVWCEQRKHVNDNHSLCKIHRTVRWSLDWSSKYSYRFSKNKIYSF